MAKIEFNELKDSMETKANKMEGKIFLGMNMKSFVRLLPMITVN